MTEFKKIQHGSEFVQVDVNLPQSKKEEELTPDELREKLSDPNFLPTHEQITKAFPNYEEWKKFCFNEENPVFEFFNEEYLNAFADYLVSKIPKNGTNKEKPLIILEIGAGNGKLSHFLQQKLEERAPGQIKVIATDSGDLMLKTDFPVEQIKHDKAMEKYSPDIVIFSWMPYKQDSSGDIRKFPSVQEYILIGENDGGNSGDEWETWGHSTSNNEVVPPYKIDGFERKDLNELSNLQICRTDEPGHYYHSRTTSFTRI